MPIHRCGDALRPQVPQAPERGPTLGVTMSGGGFRATLAALGVLRYLADADLLGNVRYVSSVSGGSITNGLLACNWPAIRARGCSREALEELVVEPIVARVSRRSLTLALIMRAWRLAGSDSRTDLLARVLDQWFFNGAVLERLDPQVRFIINAANVVTGARFTFERDVVGDYVVGLAGTQGTGLRVAQAAAASASVPGAFAAWRVRGIAFPCATQDPILLDGGVYDNTGLEVLDGDSYRDVFTVTLNAGGLLRLGGYGKVPIVRDLARANSLLYRQSTAQRTRAMVAAFQRGKGVPLDAPLPADARRGILFGLATDMRRASTGPTAWQAAFPEERTWKGKDLAYVPTVFDKLDEALCRRLVYRGWWLAGAAMAEYFPQLAPDPATLQAPPLTAVAR